MDTKTKAIINRMHDLTKNSEIFLSCVGDFTTLRKYIISNPFGQQWKYCEAVIVYDVANGEFSMPFVSKDDGTKLKEAYNISLHFVDPLKPTEEENWLFVLEFGVDHPFIGL